MAVLASVAAHGVVLGAATVWVAHHSASVPPAVSSPVPAERALPPAVSAASFPPPRADELQQAVRQQELLLGEAFLELERDAVAGLGEAPRREYARALASVRARLASGVALPRAIEQTLRQRRLDRHKRHNQTLGELLTYHGGDCLARTRLIVAVAWDSGHQDEVSARSYANHVLPVVAAGGTLHRFGMHHGCPGDGVRVEPLDLLRPAALPRATQRCADWREWFGAGISSDATIESERAGAIQDPASWMCPLAGWPLRDHGQVVTGTNGVSLTLLAPIVADLRRRSAGLACWERALAIERRPVPGQRLAGLARAIAYADEAALEFAAGGELDVTRAVERQRVAWFREAMALIESVAWSADDLLLEHWSLIVLGPPGRALLFELVTGRDDFIASNTLAVLVREPASRGWALTESARRAGPQRVEIADRCHWQDAGFVDGLRRDRQGRVVLRLREAVRELRRRWPGTRCDFDELRRLVHRECLRQRFSTSWVPSIVALLVDDAGLVFTDEASPCRREQLVSDVRPWLRQQTTEVREWLLRRRPELGQSGFAPRPAASVQQEICSSR